MLSFHVCIKLVLFCRSLVLSVCVHFLRRVVCAWRRQKAALDRPRRLAAIESPARCVVYAHAQRGARRRSLATGDKRASEALRQVLGVRGTMEGARRARHTERSRRATAARAKHAEQGLARVAARSQQMPRNE